MQVATVLSLRSRIRECQEELDRIQGTSGPQGLMQSERRRMTDNDDKVQSCEGSSDDDWGTWKAADSADPVPRSKRPKPSKQDWRDDILLSKTRSPGEAIGYQYMLQALATDPMIQFRTVQQQGPSSLEKKTRLLALQRVLHRNAVRRRFAELQDRIKEVADEELQRNMLEEIDSCVKYLYGGFARSQL